MLYPLGLDAFVWRYVGLGIDGVMWAARGIGSWPGSTIHLPAFAPWAIVFLSLAVLSSVLWRTAILRATALPLAALGLLGAAAGPSFDMAVAPAGDAVAFRAADGRLAVIGRGRNAFSTEQWLRADADGRLASEALTKANCDKLGCVGHLASGRTVALVLDTQAFAEDCTRADIIVTPRFAPLGCAANIVIDREKLKQTGALTLAFAKDGAGADARGPRGGRRPSLVARAEARLGPRRAVRGGRERRTKSRSQRGAGARRGCRCVAVGLGNHGQVRSQCRRAISRTDLSFPFR